MTQLCFITENNIMFKIIHVHRKHNIFCGSQRQQLSLHIPDDIEQIKKYFRSSTFLRLVIAAGTLAVYVFVLLGLRIGSFRLPYEAATFIYLFVTMAYFRPKGFAIWKIALISVVLSVVIGYGFSNFAKIPLP